MADRIREQIPIAQVLADMGYRVRADGGNREQQYACDLHGDGSDTKPSARVYPDSQSTYCFACDRTRDAIAMVMEREGAKFVEAIRKLENRYGLPPLPWEEGDGERPKSTAEQIDDMARARNERTFDQEFERMRKLLDGVTIERSLSMNDTLAFWEVLDQIGWAVKEAGRSEEQGKGGLDKLRERFFLRLRAGK